MRCIWVILCAAGLLSPTAVFADYPLSTSTMNLTFSEFGDLISAELCYPSCQENGQRARIGSPGAPALTTSLGPADWVMTLGLDAGSRVMRFTHPRGAEITWRIPPKGHQLKVEFTQADAGIQRVTLNSGADFRQRTAPGFGHWLESVRYFSTEDWTGFRNRYWAMMVRPDAPLDHAQASGEGTEDAQIEIDLNGNSRRMTLYLGPIEPDALESTDPQLRALMYGGLWFWLRWICFGLLWLLTAIHGIISGFLPAHLSWGISIVTLSLAVHILMRPLSYCADKLQDSVHETESRLAPELAAIRREFKGEQQAEKILALYKREGVHPLYSLKSLLGVAIVIPVFIGAFDMLAENIELAGTAFLWIDDLSLPDAVAPLPFELPFFGGDLNLLPFLMTALSVLASWLHRPPALDPSLRHRQLRNMLLLALAFFVLFYTFPAGMVLYWTTNNLISAAKGGWRHLRGPDTAPED